MPKTVTIDGNEAATYVAHKMNEVIAIYPITPASPKGGLSDEWSSRKQKNLWSAVPEIIEMQSKAGAGVDCSSDNLVRACAIYTFL